MRVTNLNDSGPGSLRQALQVATGPRTIIFETSGTINLTSDDLWVYSPYVTLAGQTAPSPGITIRGGGIRVVTHDVLIQHLHIRPGDVLATAVSGFNSNAVYVLAPAYNVVIDHVSATWATDQNTSVYVGSGSWWSSGQHDITYSNCLIAEGLGNNPVNPNEVGGMGMLIGEHSPHVSTIKNLFAHNYTRHPSTKGDSTTHVVNNVLYNTGDSAQGEIINYYNDGNYGPLSSDIIGNVHIRGANTGSGDALIWLNQNLSTNPPSQFYIFDNVTPNPLYGPTSGTGPYAQSRLVSTPPVPLTGITVLPSSQVEAYVTAHAGARPAERDSVDSRIVSTVSNRTGHVISSPKDVGGYPSVAVNVRPLTPPSNPNGDDNGNGYTNLEEWLWTFSAQVEGTTTTSPSPSPSPTPQTCPAPAAGAFTGCYYADSSLSSLAVVRTDSYPLAFNWGNGSPDPSLPADYFSTEWQGNFSFNAGTYTFTVTVDDGARLYVDGQLILDKWLNEPATTYTVTHSMTAGTHTVRLDYYEAYASATAQLSWAPSTTTASADTTPPSAPASLSANSIAANGLGLTWTASTDNVGVTSYRVYVNGTAVSDVGTTSASVTGLTCGTGYSFAVDAADAAGNRSAQSAPLAAATAACADTTGPTVAITSPSDGSTVRRTITVSATASDNVGVVGIQFAVDGAAIGSEIAGGQASLSWSTRSVANGQHQITATARDAAGNRSTAAVTITVYNKH